MARRLKRGPQWCPEHLWKGIAGGVHVNQECSQCSGMLLANTNVVAPGLRFDVLERDNFTCQYCGRSASDVSLSYLRSSVRGWLLWEGFSV